MYCRKCGTYVPGDQDLCTACRQEMTVYQQQTPQLDMSAEGRGAAISSIILGVVGLVLMIVGIVICAAAESVGGAVFVGLGSLACIVFSVINGIRGILAFRRACREKARKPIASLVCGIVGLEIAVVALIYLFVFFFAFIMAASMSSYSYYY